MSSDAQLVRAIKQVIKKYNLRLMDVPKFKASGNIEGDKASVWLKKHLS